MATMLGLEAKLFRGTAGSQAQTEVTNVRNVTLNIDKGAADITTRRAQGWKMYKATLKDATLEFEILYDPEDADFQFFSTNFFSGTDIALFVTDGAGNGVDADWSISQFNWSQELEEGQAVSVSCRPTDIGGQNSRAPQWVDGSSSSGSGS